MSFWSKDVLSVYTFQREHTVEHIQEGIYILDKRLERLVKETKDNTFFVLIAILNYKILPLKEAYNLYKYVVSLASVIPFLYPYLGNLVFIALITDYYFFTRYNTSLIFKIKSFIFYAIVTFNISTCLYLNMNMFYLIITGFIILVLWYINLYDKNFKHKYPYLYLFINFFCGILLTIYSYLVLTSPRGSMGPPHGTGGSGSGFGGGGPPGGQGGGFNWHGMPRGPDTSEKREGEIWVHWSGRSLWDRGETGWYADKSFYPTERKVYPDWNGPDGPTRPHTPPMLPRRNPIDRIVATPAPALSRRRHWEGTTIWLDHKPVEGEKYRWIESDTIWVPSRGEQFVNRDFVYRNGSWCWEVGSLENFPKKGLSFRYWYD